MFCLLTSSLLTPSCPGTDHAMLICKGRQRPHKCQDFEKLYQFPKERESARETSFQEGKVLPFLYVWVLVNNSQDLIDLITFIFL